MREEYVVDKLVAALAGMSDLDLRLLASLLAERSVRTSLSTLLDRMIALRKAENESRRRRRATRQATLPYGSDEVQNSVRPPAQHGRSQAQASELRSVFFGLLQDRDRYPSTRDVLDAMNTSFGMSLEYEKFKRRGRKDAITYCWSRLSDLGEVRRLRLLKRFLSGVATGPSEKDEYGHLFRILAKND